MSTRGVVSVQVLKILYAVIEMLYFLASKFQGFLLTIRARFYYWPRYDRTEKKGVFVLRVKI